MANMSFEIKTDNTDAILKATDEAIYNALEIVGNKAADYAAGLAPVDTGNLKNSMTCDVSIDEKAVYIGTDVEYAPYVEFGHRQEVGRYVPEIGKRLVKAYVPAKPFLKPAIVNNLEEYKGIIESELKAKIK
jgi:HK97 gp10 family phage protein